MYGGDVRVIERGQYLGFAFKTRHALGIVGQCLRQNFQRHMALELGIQRPIDFAHSAFANLFCNAIVGDHGAGFNCCSCKILRVSVFHHVTRGHFDGWRFQEASSLLLGVQ